MNKIAHTLARKGHGNAVLLHLRIILLNKVL